MNKQFSQDIYDGLNSTPKTLPSKYFYNEIGDKLFQDIMAMPEYYLTRSEDEIFREKSSELTAKLNVTESTLFQILELGAGDGSKTVKFLAHLLKSDYQIEYLPLDISQNALDGLKKKLEDTLPSLQVKPIQGDYFHSIQSLKSSSTQKIILFLGSNMGNMNDQQAIEFLSQIASSMNSNDKMILGLDQIKHTDIVLPAYNDAQGITRAFNLNLLTRINEELGGNFILKNWGHDPSYDEITGEAKSFLKSNVKQSVYIKSMDQTFHFDKNELVQTEISRKYNDEILHGILEKAGLKLASKVMDSKEYFADCIIEKA